MEKSSLHIAVAWKNMDVDNDKKSVEKHINDTFKDIFNNQFEVVSNIKYDGNREIIFELSIPFIKNNDNMIKDLYLNLKILFEELREYNPYFTQYRRVDEI